MEDQNRQDQAFQMIEKGRKIVFVIATIYIVSAVLSFFVNWNIISLGISIALSIALYRGVAWVRWFYVIGGAIGFIIEIFALLGYAQQLSVLPVWYWVLSGITTVISIVAIIFLFANKEVKTFLLYQKYGDAIAQEDQIVRLEDRVQTLEQEQAKMQEKPCPLCGEKIADGQRYCQFCGGDVSAKEEEIKKANEEKWAQEGAVALFSDESIAKQVAKYNRLYGKAASVSFLEDKAKELGLDDVKISEEDVDRILAAQAAR